MTYWQDIDYKERFVVPFDDVEGNQWKISIQSPNYSGIVVRLTGADTPIQWEGVGSDKQEDVMCGSTGTLTVVCLEGQEGIFTTGNLLPVNINDRRVQVFRFNSTASVWTLVWQGFIKPDIFSQDWDSTPYKIEIPIVSIVSALEFFELPPESDTDTYSLFSQQTSIAGLIRAIFIASGCDIRAILTNKPIYEDFNGEQHIVDNNPAHWTQGTAYSEYFYKFESGRRVAKSFKDVMETICYPYGKIHDYAYLIAIVMPWKNDAADHAELYGLNVWQNYETRTISETVRFTSYSYLPQRMLSEIQTEDTDNTLSIIPGPCRVKFSREPETEKTIFEFSDKFIKPNLPIGDTLEGLTISEFDIRNNDKFTEIEGKRYLYAINRSFVNYEAFCADLISECPAELGDYCFCRVVEVTPSGDEEERDSRRNTTAVTTPFALCFNANVVGGKNLPTIIGFTVKSGIKTTENANVVKLSFKPYRMELKNPTVGKVRDGVVAKFSVQDVTTERWLEVYESEVDGSLKTRWSGTSGTQHTISFDYCFEDSNEWLLYFNEDRSPGDRRIHYFRIYMYAEAYNAPTGYEYGRMFATFKMEYSSLPQATTQSIAAKMADGLNKNGVIEECNGSGEEIEIEFKTLCAYSYLHVDSVLLPSNSFCNARTYIDKQPRQQIEIECAKFDRNAGFDLVSTYSVVKDEQTGAVYVPVAVGLNPRFCQMKLVLISTNVKKEVWQG